MYITSIHGIFSIVSASKDQDNLIISSKTKTAMLQLFDEKRIYTSEEREFNFHVALCKQELAHIMIMMIKEINYSELNFYNDELDNSRARFFA